MMAAQVVEYMDEIEASYEDQLGPLPPVVAPTRLTNATCETIDEFSIYHWNERTKNFRCFDFGDFIGARDFEDNLGIDVHRHYS
jgi:hypothetical protein